MYTHIHTTTKRDLGGGRRPGLGVNLVNIRNSISFSNFFILFKFISIKVKSP